MTLSRQPTHDFGISGLSSYDFFPVAFFYTRYPHGPGVGIVHFLVLEVVTSWVSGAMDLECGSQRV